MILDRNAFLAFVPKLPVKEVNCPELGGSIFVRVMSAGEADRFGAESRKPGAEGLASARIIAATVCNADGALLFTAQDLPFLSTFPRTVTDPIVAAAGEVNRFGQSDEETRKNSEASPVSSSD
jgi:hypothetical protein